MMTKLLYMPPSLDFFESHPLQISIFENHPQSGELEPALKRSQQWNHMGLHNTQSVSYNIPGMLRTIYDSLLVESGWDIRLMSVHMMLQQLTTIKWILHCILFFLLFRHMNGKAIGFSTRKLDTGLKEQKDSGIKYYCKATCPWTSPGLCTEIVMF